jgi:hypothetical protein
MGWEKRRRGNTYYTRSRRVGGRVVREYIGGGFLGEAAARQDAEERAATDRRAQEWAARRAELEAGDGRGNQFLAALETYLRATLFLAGFRQHHRGEWRRPRRDGATRGRK